MTKQLCQNITVENIKTFLACRLLPLDKQLWVRPIGISQLVRRVIGKEITKLLKGDTSKAIESEQLCAGRDAGSEENRDSINGRYIKRFQCNKSGGISS